MRQCPQIFVYRGEVAKFFEPSIQSTVDSIRDNFKRRLPTDLIRLPLSTNYEQTVFLVGGFATSPWLSEQLQKRLSDLRFQFCKPDEHT